MLGQDWSNHQGVPDAVAVKAAGYDFVVIKLTGGKGYVNDLAPRQIAAATAAKLAIAFYHYDAEPSIENNTGTPEEEGAHFVANLPDPLPPGAFVALDAEEIATRDPARYAAWCDYVEHATGLDPLIYTYEYFVTESGLDWSPVAKRRLWFAEYPGQGLAAGISAAVMPTPPAPWTTVTLWQYTANATSPGVGGVVDADYFAGTPAELRALGAPGSVAVPFGETGYTIQGGFLQTYQDAGPDALSRYGYPVTQELTEQIAGQQLTVQYFERARFEYHHDTNAITFGRVGAELARARGYTQVQ